MKEEDLLALAAQIFEVPREELSLQTACGAIPQWDSVNHLRLVMEAEAAFGVHYPLERIPHLKTLADFLL